MSTSTLSSWALIRAANRNEFSLVLRQLWFKKTDGWDPVNQARFRVYLVASMLASAFGVALLFFGALSMKRVSFSLSISSVFFGAVIVGTGLLCGLYVSSVPGATGPIKTRGMRINVPLSELLTWTNKSLSDLKWLDLQQLRDLAKEILISAAIAIERSKTLKPEDEDSAEYEVWSSKHAWLISDYAHKYETLEKLGLVYGGKKYFTSEAKKRIGESAAKAPWSETPSPTESPSEAEVKAALDHNGTIVVETETG